MQRKFLFAVFVLLLAPLAVFGADNCTTIQSRQLVYQPGHYLAGMAMTPGVNPYGYNYLAHAFNGSFFNAYAGSSGLPAYDGDDAAYLAANPTASSHWAWNYRDIDLAMKWDDMWLSNKDCDGDGLLDRHHGFPSYTGSGAWLTNHDAWSVEIDGKEFKANDFIKIVANPSTATVSGPTGMFGEGTVYDQSGQVIGDRIWGEFAVIQYVVNDKSIDARGLLLLSQVSAGFGKYQP